MFFENYYFAKLVFELKEFHPLFLTHTLQHSSFLIIDCFGLLCMSVCVCVCVRCWFKEFSKRSLLARFRCRRVCFGHICFRNKFLFVRLLLIYLALFDLCKRSFSLFLGFTKQSSLGFWWELSIFKDWPAKVTKSLHRLLRRIGKFAQISSENWPKSHLGPIFTYINILSSTNWLK